MAKKTTGLHALTGNLLADGRVVFLAINGGWSDSLDIARLARGENDAAELEAEGAEAVRANVIVDPYLVEVEVGQGQLVPVELRERMRIRGPSVNLEFNSRPNGQAAIAA
ncbi:MAG TPA: DUF2849 domain-containing protein [Rhizobiales bacterium]|nr:hypothetical protein BMS3Bbin10_02222 [bacterium BMS3Bbin10]HDO51573.1 DUF2849 domain-containing protein [Hyphomicrobiales bacterium]